MIGGIGKVVEIDESAFGKRKYNRGKTRKTYWIFGGIERDSKPVKLFFSYVINRKKDSLIPIIKKFIIPGTTIIMNHTVTFKDPDSGAHTNTIEGTWFHLKRSLPTHGTRKHLLSPYFAEFIWRKKFGENFNKFIEHISLLYPPSKIDKETDKLDFENIGDESLTDDD
ncbi:unnamed protein product [Brachionus calyciflorus]|uniref:ISXO2-like transposase domain-containing protein n=1 Tax=Brachionus calyciflorus TaxID=104777 RepID=A0A814G909_9BILA|nr:unnamed protein product [Brachionus calyciflorus]